jgi:hypothetical protein
MTSSLQNAGASTEPSAFAPLHTNRIFTGYYTNRSALRDGAVSAAGEKYGYGRQDSIWDGQNTEISTRLTLIRRPGNTVFNGQPLNPIISYYAFNTFTLTSEAIKVLADTAIQVLDVTPNNNLEIWLKSPGAGRTYFSSIGNLLYFTNGIDNRIYDNDTNTTYPWGVDTPLDAPIVSQAPIPNPYPVWRPGTAFGSWWGGLILIYDPITTCMFHISVGGTTGATLPVFNPAPFSATPDGTTAWINDGSANWIANHAYVLEQTISANVSVPSGIQAMVFTIFTPGTTAASAPAWTSGLGSLIVDGSAVWINVGVQHQWADIGANTPCIPGRSGTSTSETYEILDPGGFVQSVAQSGVTGNAPPSFNDGIGALTVDGSVLWNTTKDFASAATAPRQYGYAYKNSVTKDIGNMSQASLTISVIANNAVTIQGDRPTVPSDDTIILYRTAQGGSTFLYLTEFSSAPIGGGQWTYTDSAPDSALNVNIQAQVNGEGTPLPQGASCIEYHLGRLFVAVGNVVYVATGPDAIASTSSGQAGFATTFTAQSKITRFWVTPIGLVVFTVRDSYIILGSATDADPLYMIKYIARLPLLSYDCMTEQHTTAYLYLGTRMIVALDPSSGILEASFQISNIIQQYDPKTSYLTYHMEASAENALYLSDGVSKWNRMASTSAPETGANWSPTAITVNGFSAVQSVEVTPGVWRLLLGPSAGDQRIRFRDLTTNQDDGTPYPAFATFGSITLASPGQLAAIAFITLDSEAKGTPAALFLLMNEIEPLGGFAHFESVKRTRQDPPLLPPSTSYYSDRFSLLQKQKPVWCRHFQMLINWPAENAANELIGFTIFGQLWQEFRSQ